MKFLNETMGLEYKNWQHYTEHYNNWKTTWTKRKVLRGKSGAAADPPAAWENELYDLEESNPKFNPDKRVISQFDIQAVANNANFNRKE